MHILVCIRVCLCSTFSGQNEASVTRLVQNMVASFLTFVESPKKRRSRSLIVNSQKGAFTIGDSAKSAIQGKHKRTIICERV